MSIPIDRLNEYEKTDFDALILFIKSGTIKAGRFAHLVKVDPKKKMKGKVFFDDGSESTAETNKG